MRRAGRQTKRAFSITFWLRRQMEQSFTGDDRALAIAGKSALDGAHWPGTSPEHAGRGRLAAAPRIDQTRWSVNDIVEADTTTTGRALESITG